VSERHSSYLILHHPPGFPEKSCFMGLVTALKAEALWYEITYEKVMQRSWTLGYLLRRWGDAHYGTTWNALVPFLDEWRLSRRIDSPSSVIHFLWGEFASPRWPRLFRKKGGHVVGTFHCSARRQPKVLGQFKCWKSFDRISVVSKTQIPFIAEQGFDPAQIPVVRLGVDTRYFVPDPAVQWPDAGPLRGVLVGKTERDHEFMAEVLRKLPAGILELSICTAHEGQQVYRGVPNSKVLPFLDDHALVKLYQQAELMVMPMLDVTANDAMLEAMACGTPVMTNNVGGVPEYLDRASSFIMDGRNADEWADQLVALARDRQALHDMRRAVRVWAESFDWQIVAPEWAALHDFGDEV